MKKKVVFLFILIIILLCKVSQAKYIIKETVLMAKINIDTLAPKIDLMNITSIPYLEYQNKTHKINIQVKVTEKNIKENKFNKDNINITTGKNQVDKELYEINKIEEAYNYIIYEIKMDKILIDDELKIIISEGIIQDFSNNKNEELIVYVKNH